MMRLKKNLRLCDKPFKKKVSATLKVSLWFNNRCPLGSYRGLNQSEILKGGPPSDWPWFRYSCMCVYVWKCLCCYSQTEREVSSRDARSVANLATLSLDLATFQTPLANLFPKKQLVTNLVTSWTNFSESLWSLVLPQRREISAHAALPLHLLCSVSVSEEQPVQFGFSKLAKYERDSSKWKMLTRNVAKYATIPIPRRAKNALLFWCK